MKKQRVGILGTGDVGKALGRGFASRGCDVKIGSRTKKGELVTFEEAAQHGEIIALALRWDGAENALKLADPKNFAGKVVIDATNPFKHVDGRPAGMERGFSDSGGEQVQRWLPDAKVVKAFNIVGNALMVDPKLPGGPPTMFIGGNDEGAKKVVTDILTDFGWETIDLGGIEASRMLEPMCLVWVTSAMKSGKWMQAFKMLRA
ncbi:MAG: putative dinucleotide-binding enzyme [bacterium]|nr:putative dinucleotide-binding enzyme [bacterium]